MQQARHRIRWPAEHHNPHANTSKPLPAKPPHPPSILRTPAKSPKTSLMHSPVPTISVDDSACFPVTHTDRFSQYLADTPEVTRRRVSFHPHSGSGSGSAVHMSRTPRRPIRSSGQPPPPFSQHIRAAVISFLDQQEREMRAEVLRVGAEIRDLKQCVRAFKRERGLIVQTQMQYGHGFGRSGGIEDSGSDADTEEVSVVVISAD